MKLPRLLLLTSVVAATGAVAIPQSAQAASGPVLHAFATPALAGAPASYTVRTDGATTGNPGAVGTTGPGTNTAMVLSSSVHNQDRIFTNGPGALAPDPFSGAVPSPIASGQGGTTNDSGTFGEIVGTVTSSVLINLAALGVPDASGCAIDSTGNETTFTKNQPFNTFNATPAPNAMISANTIPLLQGSVALADAATGVVDDYQLVIPAPAPAGYNTVIATVHLKVKAVATDAVVTSGHYDMSTSFGTLLSQLVCPGSPSAFTFNFLPTSLKWNKGVDGLPTGYRVGAGIVNTNGPSMPFTKGGTSNIKVCSDGNTAPDGSGTALAEVCGTLESFGTGGPKVTLLTTKDVSDKSGTHKTVQFTAKIVNLDKQDSITTNLTIKVYDVTNPLTPVAVGFSPVDGSLKNQAVQTLKGGGNFKVTYQTDGVATATPIFVLVCPTALGALPVDPLANPDGSLPAGSVCATALG